MSRSCVVLVEGPLAPFAVSFEQELDREGFSKGWKQQLMCLAAELSAWLQAVGLDVSDLDGPVIDAFFAGRDGADRSRCRTARSLGPLLRHLGSLGLLAGEEQVGIGRDAAERELLDSYWRWCLEQRGLALVTTEQYVPRVARFLVLWRPDPVGEVDITELDGAAVLATVRAAAELMPGPSLRCMVTALRSFLRFLHATARTSSSLVAAVPALKTWPRSALPVTIPADDARRLVAACDGGRPRDLRDAAVLLLLLRLGLRAIEVSRLGIDDIDWREGHLTVSGKGGRAEQMPLPVEVGEAIARYLHDARPPHPARSVFLTVTAPIRPLSHDAVTSLVYRVCQRGGVGRVGPHVLRRTLATETLRAGAPMSEVAQLLRHTDQATASTYAAVDSTAVQALARPWPQVPR